MGALRRAQQRGGSVRFVERNGASKPPKKQPVQSADFAAQSQLLTGEHLEKHPTARLFGYARVSTEDQILDVQLEKLREAGVQKNNLFFDKMSAVNAHRDGYRLMRKQIQRGDFLIVYSVSRLARDAKMLLTILDDLEAEGVTVVSLTERLDLKSATGRMQITILAAVDEAERGRVRERTKDAMQLRKRQGMYLGRPVKVTDAVRASVRKMKKLGIPVREIARKHDLSTSAVYGAL